MKEKVTQGTLVSFRFNSSIICRSVFLPKRFCVVPTNLSSWDMLVICRSKWTLQIHEKTDVNFRKNVKKKVPCYSFNFNVLISWNTSMKHCMSICCTTWRWNNTFVFLSESVSPSASHCTDGFPQGFFYSSYEVLSWIKRLTNLFNHCRFIFILIFLFSCFGELLRNTKLP